MKVRRDLGKDLLALATHQAGVLSRDQLLRAGMSRAVIARMLCNGLLTTLTAGIYTRAGDTTWLGRAWAGLLIGGRSAVLGGAAAGHLQQLVREAPDVITVYTARQVTPRDGWQFIRGTRKARGEPSRTCYEATVIDLCDGRDEDALAALLADAVSSRRTSAPRLLAEVNSRGRIRHRSLLREVLGDVSQGAQSALERRFLLAVERPHALPTATRQAHAHNAHRSDAWYESFGLLVELDGTLHHRGAAAFHDMTRDNDHARAGLLTLRFGWAHVTGSAACATAHYVAATLMARGWPGPAMPCSNCSRVHSV